MRHNIVKATSSYLRLLSKTQLETQRNYYMKSFTSSFILCLVATALTCTAADVNYSGLSDIYESIYFNGPADPFADADGDGVSNFDEMLWGTNPTNAASAVAAPASSLTGTDFILTWPVVTHRTYQLEASADLQIWQIVASGAASSYTERLAALNALPHRFYRLHVTLDPTDTNANGLADWEETLYQQTTGHPLNSTADTDADGLPDAQEFPQARNFLKKDHPAVALVVFTPLEK